MSIWEKNVQRSLKSLNFHQPLFIFKLGCFNFVTHRALLQGLALSPLFGPLVICVVKARL
jgi:hypothetical protein